MPSFANFADTLPDPVNKIGTAGQSDPTTGYGEGFRTIKLSSSEDIMKSRVNSGRVDARDGYYHKWLVDITYNKLPPEEFKPIFSFLMQHQYQMTPFYVVIPQYAGQTTSPKEILVNDYTTGSTTLTVDASIESSIVGEMFNLSDTDYKKAYIITRIEDNTDYVADYVADEFRPAVGQERVYFSPGLEPGIVQGGGLSLVFSNPRIYVNIVEESLKYSLDDDNLYSLSIKLEEFCDYS